jgi:hypothetical protein
MSNMTLPRRWQKARRRSDHRRIDFASAIRTRTAPMPSYVEHHADVDQIGKLSAEAVIAQYEGAVKALEAMGTTLIDCANARRRWRLDARMPSPTSKTPHKDTAKRQS